MTRAIRRVGKLSPRYAFALNPFKDARFSHCPKCKGVMNMRKFALFIHVDGWGPLSLGKTSRYCPRCELMIVHQDELEEQLCNFFDQYSPELIGNDYFVLGTVRLKAWKEGLRGTKLNLEQISERVSDFKKYVELKVDRGGWHYENPSG